MLNRKFLLIVFIFSSILLGFKGYFFYKNIEEEKALTLILQEEAKKREEIREEILNKLKDEGLLNKELR